MPNHPLKKQKPLGRRQLDRRERTRARRHQVRPVPHHVPHPTISDELDYPGKAASFHKLLTHDPNTGLLDAAGLQSYAHLLAGLKSDGSNEFRQDELNQIVPGNPPASGSQGQVRVLINPQASKAIAIKGADPAVFWLKKKAPVTHPEWEMGYTVEYGGSVDHHDLLHELSFRRASTAAELVELYAMAILRNVPLDRLADPTIAQAQDVQKAVAALNAFGADFKGPKDKTTMQVTAATLFRGNSPADQIGDYRSKFLSLKRPPQFPSGCAPSVGVLIGADIFFDAFAQTLAVPDPNPDLDFVLTWDHYVQLQNGKIPRPYQLAPVPPPNPPPGTPPPPQNPPPDLALPTVVVETGRQAASLVHVDSLYQEHAWAVDVLTGGNYARSAVSPYAQKAGAPGGADHEGDGPTLGPPDAAGLVGAVALEAARLAWSQKWLVTRRARPEHMAALVHKQRTNGADPAIYGPLDAHLLATSGVVHDLLERAKAVNAQRGSGQVGADTYLLGQVFPEGSPGHPAWPSGHATVAGACVTVIKAIFDDRKPVLQQEGPSKGQPFMAGGQPLLVGQELDKLASNIALARSFAGVHFRSDGEHGILLGEAIAIRFLQDHLRTYREQFLPCSASEYEGEPHFDLSKRSGERIHVFADRVEPAQPTSAAVPPLQHNHRAIL